jgi:UV DNA damage endonuclease
MIRKNFSIEKAKQLALQNVKDLIPMIEYNYKHGITCFRLSSDMFPHFTDSETEPYTISFAEPYLRRAGDLANKYGIRILMHPGQYNQVGAKSEDVFQKTIQDLKHHADILDMMGIDNNGVLIVHGGGTYGDKESTKKRWISQFSRLPKNVRKRLVLENCEKGYSPRDVLDIAKQCKIPVVYDCHHYTCYRDLHPGEILEKPREFMDEIIQTWGTRRMLCHVSSQGEGRTGHHADYITKIPKHMIKILKKKGVGFDLEVEAKMKEKAIFDLAKKYPELFPNIVV